MARSINQRIPSAPTMSPNTKPTSMLSLYIRDGAKGLRTLFTVALVLIGVTVAVLSGQGTLTPTPYQVLSDSNGNPIVAGKVCTYVAGSATPATTYADAAYLSSNTNPIVTDSSGRWTAFLVPGQSYKFVIYSNDGTANTCNGTILKTQDNVSAVPTSSNNIDVSGTAGEAITAGQVVYLSDGSGGKVAGSWYLANATNTYSSTTAIVGMAPANIASGSIGAIRLSGTMTGLAGLVVGSDYYVSASVAGAITVTAPMNVRFVGRADTTTSLVLAPSVTPNTQPRYTAQTGASYTAVAYDLVAVTSTGTFPVTLPAAASNTNKTIWVVNNGTGSVSVLRSASDTIGLVTSQTLNPGTSGAQGDSMIFISDGVSNWNIL